MKKDEPGGQVGSHWEIADREFCDELGIASELRDIPDVLRHERYIKVNSVWFEMPIGVEWILAARLFSQNGAPVIGEIRIFPREDFRQRDYGEWSASQLGNRAKVPASGITAPLIRSLQLGAFRRGVAKGLDWFLKNGSKEDQAAMKEHLAHMSFPIQPAVFTVEDPWQKKRRGRPALPEVELARIAQFYVMRFDAGSASPVAETGKHFRISTARARSRLHQARARGLLTGGGSLHGIAGGSLTEKAKSVLEKDK